MEMDDARKSILRARGDVFLATLLLPCVNGADFNFKSSLIICLQ